MSENQSDLGALLFSCEKVPDKEAAIAANGGSAQLLATAFIIIPAFALVASAGIAASMGLLEKHSRTDRGQLTLILACTLLGLYVLGFLLWRVGLATAAAMEVHLFEDGIRICKLGRVQECRFDEITAVYFGTQSKLVHVTIALAQATRTKWAQEARDGMAQRLSFEFSHDRPLRIPMFCAYFREESIAQLFQELENRGLAQNESRLT